MKIKMSGYDWRGLVASGCLALGIAGYLGKDYIFNNRGIETKYPEVGLAYTLKTELDGISAWDMLNSETEVRATSIKKKYTSLLETNPSLTQQLEQYEQNINRAKYMHDYSGILLVVAAAFGLPKIQKILDKRKRKVMQKPELDKV